MKAYRLSLTFLFLSCAAFCQDLLTVAPNAVKVEYEDARIRVIRLRLAPNESLPMHDRPSRVVIPLTPNHVRATRAEGTTSEITARAGIAAWSEPGRRSITNLNVPLENIVVELKQATAPAKALSGPPTPHPADYLDEKFHHWQFENQFVRVFDVRIPPGETTDFHLHALDTVFIEISGGHNSAQVQGQPWGKAEDDPPGSVFFSGDSKKSRTHRVRNESTTEFHVIAVQVLPQ